MHANHGIDNVSPETIQSILADYPNIVAEKLHDLDKARYESIPSAIAERKGKGDGNASLTKHEVSKLVEWKLSHGTFRPSLKKLVESNSEDDIKSTTESAFATFDKDPSNVKASLTELTKLKGIGPATASLLLSVYSPTHAPFFSDELYRWAFWEDKKGSGWDRTIKYNPKEYLELFEKIAHVLKRLEGVQAVELEKVAYVLGRRAVGKVKDTTAAKRKAADEVQQEDSDLTVTVEKIPAEKSKTKKAKVSKTKAPEPARGTRASARMKERVKKR